MKKMRFILVMLVCLTMLVSLTVVSVSAAGETVTSTLDFATLTAEGTEDMAVATEAIKGMGAVEASNLIIFDCHTKCVAGKGYEGAGYFVQKLDAGAGKVFAEAPVLTLNYRLAKADPMGYIKVEGSVDGITYYPFTELKDATGDSYSLEAKKSTTVTLEGGQGYSTVFVKITVEHWGAPDAAAVDASSITASVREDPNATPVVPGETVSSNMNFGSLTKNEDQAAAAEAIKGLGIVEVDNLYIDDCYTPFLSVKGYEGPGYFVQKLEAGKGKLFASDVTMELNYRLTTADPQGKITVMVSTDGTNYTDVKVLNESTGEAFKAEAKASTKITLTGTADASAVWVKVVLENWSSPDGCGVDATNLTAVVTGGSDGSDGSDTPSKTGGLIVVPVALALMSTAGAAGVIRKKDT